MGVLDKRKDRQHDPDTGKFTIAPSGASGESRKSAESTASILGISPRKVERTRTVLDHADEGTKRQVLAGEKTVNRG